MRWMNDLSAELHKYIYGYLPRKELLVMSGMSRRYRDIAEEFLYKELVFDQDHYFRITSLFLTIVGRPKLAELIRSVTITYKPGPRMDSVVDDAYYLRFWNNIPAIRDTIGSLGKDLNWELISQWFGHIYKGEQSFDGALAAIVCLAPNLEHLQLEPLAMTGALLGHSWRHSDDSPDTRPFRKLKTLCMRGVLLGGTAPVFPWMETLSINCDESTYGGYDPPVHFPYPTSPLSTKLRVLEMHKAVVSPTALETLFAFPELVNVKELKISGVSVGMGSLWDADFDLRRITQVIEDHIPDLEVLHWFQHDWDKGRILPATFGSFKGLSKLRELKLDVQLLATHDLRQHNDAEALPLSRPREYLPDSLEALHILRLSAEDDRIDQILQVARTINLQTVELSLELEDWYYERSYRTLKVHELRKTQRKFFRDTVANMTALGVTMRVWRQEGTYPEEKLFALGFQRPWPIWVEADKLDWSKRVRAAWETKQGIVRSPEDIDSDSDSGSDWHHHGQQVQMDDSSDQGDSDVDKDGKIANQGGNKKKSGDEKQGDDKKQDDDKNQGNGKNQCDGEKQGDNGAGDMVAEKGSDGDEGRSESGAARK